MFSFKDGMHEVSGNIIVVFHDHEGRTEISNLTTGQSGTLAAEYSEEEYWAALSLIHGFVNPQ